MPEYIPEINPFFSSNLVKKSMLNIPDRNPNAKSGSEFARVIYNMPPDTRRDRVICDEILSGNIPDFMRNLATVTLLDRGNLIQYYVGPDYLSVGNDNDYLRITLGGRSAKSLLDSMNCGLPTSKMVDNIWQSSDLKLPPAPMGSSSGMVYSPALIEHNRIIQNQIAGRQFQLLGGSKKDIIIGKPLLTYRDRIGIYGWQYLNSIPIQGPNPNYTHHIHSYMDYSQAIRIVSRSAYLNNQPIDLYDALKNPQYSYLLSREGSFDPSSIYT